MTIATTTIKVYLNEDENGFFGFHTNKFSQFPATPALRLAVSFDLDERVTGDPKDNVKLILSSVFEQLNIGGDLIPASDYTVEYRANRNRSLSVGDVVIVGESAYAVASFGWDPVSTDELVAAIGRAGS